MAARKLVDFSPLAEQMTGMLGSARDAFNRHSRAGLDQFKNLQAAALKEIEAVQKKVEASMGKAKAEEKAFLADVQIFLTGLVQLVETMAGLWDPLEKKLKDNVLFSEKAVAQTNGLFDGQTGLLRSMFDIIQTGNQYLVKFVQEEGLKTQKDCAEFATEHETRLIEGLCTPKAAPIFLAILERFRLLGQQIPPLVQQFGKKS